MVAWSSSSSFLQKKPLIYKFNFSYQTDAPQYVLVCPVRLVHGHGHGLQHSEEDLLGSAGELETKLKFFICHMKVLPKISSENARKYLDLKLN